MDSSRAGPSTGTRRTTRSSATASSAGSSSATAAAASLKKRTRSTSSDIDKDLTSSKRPALSSTFSAHIAQSSLNRQLLAAQSKVTELENALLEKQGSIDRLEADRRLLAGREEDEREGRKRCEKELAEDRTRYEAELSSLRKRFTDLEADHEDLNDAYSNLLHTTQSQISSLEATVAARDQTIAHLEEERERSDERARDLEIQLRELQELSEIGSERDVKIFKEGGKDDSEGVDLHGKGPGEGDDVSESDESGTEERVAFAREGSMGEDELDADADSDVDADGEAEADISFQEDVPRSVDPQPSTTSVASNPEFDISSTREASHENVFTEGTHLEAYPDPGAPPPYTISSPSIASSRSASIASSRPMSLTGTLGHTLVTPHRPSRRSMSGTPMSVNEIESASASGLARPRPHHSSKNLHLAHIKSRLSTPARSDVGRRRLSSPSRARDKGREEDYAIIREELKRQTAHTTTLEAENSRLKADLERTRTKATGTEVLREEKRELERRLEGAEKMRRRVAELEEEIAGFAAKEREWERRLSQTTSRVTDENNVPSKTPVSITQQLTEARRARAALLDENGQLKANLRAREIELEGARAEAQTTNDQLNSVRKDVLMLQDAVSRKEKERGLLERDVTFLKSLVTSYKTEEETFQPSSEESTRARAKLEQRVVQLETLLSEYKDTNGALEKEVDGLQRMVTLSSGRPQEQWDQLVRGATAVEEAFRNAEATVKKQAEEIDKLEQRLFELEGEIGGGRHVPPGIRVVALRQNPLQEWADSRKEVLDRLKSENDALLARVKELEEMGVSTTSEGAKAEGDIAMFVPRESWEGLKHEKEELESVVKQKEKRLLRLQQVFTAKSTEFREAIESILGLKLAFYPNGQVRVTSIYDLSAAFVFQPSKEEGAKMQLIASGEDGPMELEQVIQYWVQQEMNIPCFMASVTLECYDKVRRARELQAGA